MNGKRGEFFLNEEYLNSLKPRLIKRTKFLFTLLGFGIGGLISFISITIEDIENGVSVYSDIFHTHHIVIPISLGLLGAVLGLFHDRMLKKEKDIYNRLFESQQNLSIITNNLPVLISYLDINLKYLYANKTHKEWFNFNPDEIYGKHIKEIIGLRSYYLVKKYLLSALSGNTVSFESMKTTFKDNRPRYVNSTIVPHFNSKGNIIGIISLVTDISELKENEETIKFQNEELLNINSTKDKLFSIIAHDLRNPINNIAGFSDILTNKIHVLETEKSEKFLKNINESARQVSNLLENLLTWARMQTGTTKLSLENTDVKSTILEVVELLNLSAFSKNIHVNTMLEDDIVINVDRNMFQTIVRNIISNAIKFTNNGGYINIRTFSNSENIKILIEDNGVGMDENTLEKLFKIDSNTSIPGTANEKGSGLGLIICKEFIEKNKGRIWVESELGKGTRFFLEFPKL